MKKIPLLILLLALVYEMGISQSVPQGMSYQAVARDLSGDILANQDIALKIILHTNIERETAAYTEVHNVRTNKLGLFTLVIGQGETSKGKFQEIPWSTNDIWMEVAIKDGSETDFATISNSKLLAVPYAFHAGSASELLGDPTRGPGGVPAKVWSKFGNSNVDDSVDVLGTTDCADLVIVTNDIERLRITCEGDISIENNLEIGANLNVDSNAMIGQNLIVKQNVDLNTEGGSTTVNGDLTVANMSSTLLTGTLTVDKATDLNSTLNVDGTTDLNDDLTVTGMSATTLTGTLSVDKATDLNSTLNVDGTTNLNDDLTVTGMSATTLTGTLAVDKATDLNSTLNVDGTTNLNDDLTVTGMSATTLTGTLDVDKATTLNSTLDVTGDATFEGDVTVDGQINSASSYVSGTASIDLGGQSYVACFENTDSASDGTDGIAIKVGKPGAAADWHDDGDNDYVTFFNGQNQATGSIEGFEILHDNPISTFPVPDFSDFFNIFDFSGAITLPSVDWANIIDFDAPSLDIDFTGLDASFDPGGISIDFANEFDPGGFDPGAFFNPSAAAGAVQSIADIVCWGISNGMESLITTNPFDLILATTVIVETNLCKENNGKGGVTYVSFGADYAEWLPRSNPNETMKNGQIVGVKNGKISKNTADADQILAVSTNPIVLGNTPPENSEGYYEKVGFMGQVPVLVSGVVREGDYILPSGKHDGIGIAVTKEDLKMEHIPQILGRAWSNSENDFLSYINVAVGLNRNDIATVAMKQEKDIQTLKDELASLRNGLQDQMAELTSKMRSLEEGQNGETKTMNSYVAERRKP